MKVPISFSVGYINIDDLHRKWIGCKIPHLKDSMIFDITVILGTWSWSCNHSTDIDNYSYLVFKLRLKSQKNLNRVDPQGV